MSVEHYENFPVASKLMPPALREPVAAIYWFARHADDLADEGDAAPDARLAALEQCRDQLRIIERGGEPDDAIHRRLARAVRQWSLPLPLFHDLLDAFAQDVVQTRYASHTELLDYCRRSANPVGRLLLHLYGVHGDAALRESDAICSALQLINFWQDLSVDLPRGRHYLTDADCAAHGVERADLAALRRTPASDRLVLDCAAWARGLMLQGAPLVRRLPGRAGWELRLVVQGGLRILDKVQALGGASLTARPRLGAPDWLRMLARAVRM